MVYYCGATRRSEGGIAPVSGTGDRGFESRRFDQKDRFLTVFFHSVEAGEDENPPRAIHIVRTLIADDFCSYYLGARIGFAFSAQSASSSLVSGKRENIHF